MHFFFHFFNQKLLIYTYIKFYWIWYKENLMNEFTWRSSEVKAAEWAYAKQQLSPNGKMMPDGTKLSRKVNAGFSLFGKKLTHSFIILDQKIFAMAPKGEILGEGRYARAKMAEDEDGGLWALRIVSWKKYISPQELESFLSAFWSKKLITALNLSGKDDIKRYVKDQFYSIFIAGSGFAGNHRG